MNSMLLAEPLETTCEKTSRVLGGRDLQPLIPEPPVPSCEICVVIPVRDEAQSLAATLYALTHQVDCSGQPFDHRRYEIILLVNNCCDDSAAVARQFAQQHPTLHLHVVEITLPAVEAHVGRARQLLMDEAYRRLTSLGRGQSVIASTDGDTRVAPTWLAATLDQIEQGADAVGGRILLDRTECAALDRNTWRSHLRYIGYRCLVAELEAYLDADPHDPWPRHYQHFGASLAVTPQMYERVGGLAAVRAEEDVAFYRALVRADARVRHSPAVRVVTSARPTGRTPLGLAARLSEWQVMEQQHLPYLVESVPALEARLRARYRLRLLWQRTRLGQLPERDLASLASGLCLPATWLADELNLRPSFGLLLERIEQHQRSVDTALKRWPLVEVRQAISELRLRLERLRQER